MTEETSRPCNDERHDTPCLWDICQACQEECPEPEEALIEMLATDPQKGTK